MDVEDRGDKTFIQKNTVDFCEVHALERTKTWCSSLGFRGSALLKT